MLPFSHVVGTRKDPLKQKSPYWLNTHKLYLYPLIDNLSATQLFFHRIIKYSFQVSFSLNVILHVAKRIQNIMTKLL